MTPLTWVEQLLPWQKLLGEKWMAVYQNHRLPPALLLTGNPGLGQDQFAEALANLVLNTDSSHLLQHPDFYSLKPEEGSSIIKIDQVRACQDKLWKTTYQGGYRVVIISPADALNLAAGNALLKILEEPPPSSLILLITNVPHRLLWTIKSRCQQIHFKFTPNEESFIWLKENLKKVNPDVSNQVDYFLRLSENSPFWALALAEPEQQVLRRNFFNGLHAVIQGRSALSIFSEKFSKNDIRFLFFCLLSWLFDAVRLNLNVLDVNNVSHVYVQILTEWKTRFSLPHLFKLIDTIYTLSSAVSRVSSLNTQNLLESVLIEWVECAYD